MQSTTFRPQDKFYQLDQSLLLNFAEFYEPIITDLSKLILKPFDDFNLEFYLDIQFGKEFKAYVVQKSQLKQTNTQLIHINSLGSSFYENIYHKLSKKQMQSQSLRTFIEDLFNKKSINSADLLVKNIYGPDASSIGLSQNLLASSLGKLAKQKIEDFDEDEILRSTMLSIAVNTGQITGLLSIKHGIDKVLVSKNELDCLAFNRLIGTILKYNNPKAKIYFKQHQTSEQQLHQDSEHS